MEVFFFTWLLGWVMILWELNMKEIPSCLYFTKIYEENLHSQKSRCQEQMVLKRIT